MYNYSTFMKVNLKEWVLGTINLVEQGREWSDAWESGYYDLGGISENSGVKECPKNGAKTLYLLGRIKGGTRPYLSPSLHEVWHNYSKNGAYAILAIDCLARNPNIRLKDLWQDIRRKIIVDLHEQPATNNAGGPTVAYKLWHLGMIETK